TEVRERTRRGDDAIINGEPLQIRCQRLYSVAVGGGDAKLLTSQSLHVVAFDWSPGGTKIALAGQKRLRMRDDGNVDLYELDVRSGREHVIVAQPGRDDAPVYSPDGRWIVFHSQGGRDDHFGERHLGLVPASGGAIRYLTQQVEGDLFRGSSFI